MSRSRLTRGRRRIALAAVILAGAALTGCSPAAEPETAPSPSPSATGGTEADVFSLKVGDCFDDDGQTQLTTVEVIDCSEPHTYEAYFSALMEGDEYPGEDAIAEFGDDRCRAAFEDFVGVDEDETSIGFTYYSPLEASWEGADDREILCIAGDTNGRVSEPLKDAGSRYPIG